MSALQNEILAALRSSKGKGLTTGDLADAIYGDTQPLTVYATIRGQVTRLNKSLSADGKRIVAARDDGVSRWHIVDSVKSAPERPRHILTPPPKFPARPDRFYAGAQPRYGR